MLESWQESILEGLGAVAALVYLFVAYLQWKRQVSTAARSARNGFVLWWAGLGILGLYGWISAQLWQPEDYTLAGYRVIIYTLIPLIFAAIGGLVYYLAYLYTGDKDWKRTVLIFYVILTIGFVGLVEAQQPFVGPDEETGEIGLQYAGEAPDWVGLIFSLALILPPFAAAVAYFLLFFRTKERTVRYRILMVSVAFIFWMGFSLIGSLSRFATGVEEQGFAASLTSQLLGLLAALLVVLAYRPPQFMRRALNLEQMQPSRNEPAPPLDMFDPPRRMERASGATPIDSTRIYG